MNIEEFVNDYLKEHRHDVLLCPYIALVEFANTFKKKMMEEAVEGVICKDEYRETAPFYYVESELFNLPHNMITGDKVRVIILPKED